MNTKNSIRFAPTKNGEDNSKQITTSVLTFTSLQDSVLIVFHLQEGPCSPVQEGVSGHIGKTEEQDGHRL